MCHISKILELLSDQQLEDVCGAGWDVQRTLDAGNTMARSSIEAGGYLGAGYGVWRGYLAHRRDATSYLGIAKTTVPVRVTAAGAGVLGGMIATGAVGWVGGAGTDIYRQYKGLPPAGVDSSQ